MKKLMIVLAITLTGIIVTHSRTSSAMRSPARCSYSLQEQAREKIQERDLPEAVKESLKASDYAGWTVEAAYKVRMTNPDSPESEGTLIYLIEMKRQDETISVRFDKDGKRLEEDGK
jgi:hypothetical protein